MPQESANEIRAPERRAWRVRDFCREFGISRSTTYKLMKQGRLQTVCVGRRRLIPAAEAARLLREGA